MALSVTEYSAQLGISRPLFYKWAKVGLPTDNLEAAKKWIEERRATESRGGKRTKTPETLLDLKEALLRANLVKVEAEGRLKEFEAEIAAKNLVSMDSAKAHIAECLTNLRALLDSLPKATAIKANPSDPQLAEEAIREGVDGVFRAMEAAGNE